MQDGIPDPDRPSQTATSTGHSAGDLLSMHVVPGRLTCFTLQLFGLSKAYSAASTGCNIISALQAERQMRPWCKTPSSQTPALPSHDPQTH